MCSENTFSHIFSTVTFTFYSWRLCSNGLCLNPHESAFTFPFLLPLEEFYFSPSYYLITITQISMLVFTHSIKLNSAREMFILVQALSSPYPYPFPYKTSYFSLGSISLLCSVSSCVSPTSCSRCQLSNWFLQVTFRVYNPLFPLFYKVLFFKGLSSAPFLLILNKDFLKCKMFKLYLAPL